MRDIYQKATSDFYKNFPKGSKLHNTLVTHLLQLFGMYWTFIIQPTDTFPPETVQKLEQLRETFGKEGILDLIEQHQQQVNNPKKCDNPSCKNTNPTKLLVSSNLIYF
jgi:hypothetical protein